MKHRICPICGAVLDPCEICDCEDKNTEDIEDAGTDFSGR